MTEEEVLIKKCSLVKLLLKQKHPELTDSSLDRAAETITLVASVANSVEHESGRKFTGSERNFAITVSIRTLNEELKREYTHLKEQNAKLTNDLNVLNKTIDDYRKYIDPKQ